MSKRVTLYYYLFRCFLKKPKILSKKKTIEYILKHNCCVSRFGDGEMKIIMKTGAPKFQEQNQQLTEELKASFTNRNPKLLVCLAKINYRFPINSVEGIYYKNYLYYTYRKAISRKIIDRHYRYGNTDITRFYHPSLRGKMKKQKIEKYVTLLKRLWDKRNIIFVEGSETKLGLGNDLFDNVLSIRRIICPPVNAFSKKQKIIDSIKEHYIDNDLVLVALGPTASIITAELACSTNIQAIDIGHVDIVYLWFSYNAKETIPIFGKYVNESHGDNGIEIAYDDKKYSSQIIDIIA